jgi:hypothetical protein
MQVERGVGICLFPFKFFLKHGDVEGRARHMPNLLRLLMHAKRVDSCLPLLKYFFKQIEMQLGVGRNMPLQIVLEGMWIQRLNTC